MQGNAAFDLTTEWLLNKWILQSKLWYMLISGESILVLKPAICYQLPAD